MADWMNPEEAMRYFGVDLEALEALVLEYDIDIDVDDDGNLIAINAADCKEPLFKEHEKHIGHRPDDYRAHEKAVKDVENQEAKEKKERDEKRVKLVSRISNPG